MVASDPVRVRIGTKRSRDSPWGFLNKETICHGSREKREEGRVAFAKIDRNHPKN